MKGKFVLLIALIFAANIVNAQKKKNKISRKTTASILGNYAFGNYIYSDKNGHFETKDAFLKFGLGISKDYYFRFLPANTFLTFGLRYKATGAYIKSHTYLKGFAPDSYNEVTLYYNNLSAPIYIGKTIIFKNKKTLLDVFGGISSGVCKTASGTNHSSFYSLENNNVGMTFPDFLNIDGYKFYSSLDAGFRFMPFDQRRFSLGLIVAYDLNKTQPLRNQGEYVDYTENTHESYSYTFSRRFVNLLFNINYSFGKNWK